MSTIVGVKREGTIVIGADSRGTQGWTVHQLLPDSKVYAGKDILIGSSGSLSVSQIIFATLKQGLPSSPSVERVASDNDPLRLAWLLRNVCQELDILEDDPEGGKSCPNAFLVGHKGRLFQIGTDFAVLESACEYQALGGGADFALGAMYQAAKDDWRSAVAIARCGLEAACEMHMGTGLPLDIHTMEIA